MKEPKCIDITIDEITFSCVKKPDGEWACTGRVNDLIVSVQFPNSAPTHVFQHIENIVKHRI